MTPEESHALQQLLSQLTQIQGINKDPEADRMIAQAVARQPDAAYLLIQRTMILEQALNAAKEQISQLQSQASQSAPASPGRSFLDANAWGNHAPASAPSQRPVETSVTGRPLGSTGQGQGQWSGPAMGAMPGRGSSFLGSGGSMLGTMAATAAGVAGGAFLFHGIGNLLGNHNHGDAQSQALAEKTPAADSANELNNAGSTDNQYQSLADEAGASSLDESLSDSSGFDDSGFEGDSHEA